MKLVFQENPKFGDEQDVTQQITAIEENIEKLLAEIKRFEVHFSKRFQWNIPFFFSRTFPKSNEQEFLLHLKSIYPHVYKEFMILINQFSFTISVHHPSIEGNEKQIEVSSALLCVVHSIFVQNFSISIDVGRQRFG